MDKTRHARGKKKHKYREPIHRTCQTGRLTEPSSRKDGTTYNPAMYECFEPAEETVETHIVPRLAVTTKQALGVLPVPTEVMDLKREVTSLVTGEIFTISNPEIVRWRSRSLLIKGNPFGTASEMPYGVKRQTSRTKQISNRDDTAFNSQERELRKRDQVSNARLYRRKVTL